MFTLHEWRFSSIDMFSYGVELADFVLPMETLQVRGTYCLKLEQVLHVHHSFAVACWKQWVVLTVDDWHQVPQVTAASWRLAYRGHTAGFINTAHTTCSLTQNNLLHMRQRVTSTMRSEGDYMLLSIWYVLHRLPILTRNDFKILSIVYKTLNISSPNNISVLLNLHPPSRWLRSSSSGFLVIPQHKTRLESAFSY